MRQQSSLYTSGFAAKHQPEAGTLDELLANSVLPMADGFGLIVFSAALEYGFGETLTRPEKVARGLALASRLAPSGRVLVIEPKAKTRELGRLQEVLASIRLRTRTLTSQEASDFTLKLPMSSLTRLISHLSVAIESSGRLSAGGSRLLGRPPWPVESWAKSTDVYLFAEPEIDSRRLAYRLRTVIERPASARSATSTNGRIDIPKRTSLARWLVSVVAILSAVAVASWVVGWVLPAFFG